MVRYTVLMELPAAIMGRVKAAFEASDLTLDELGTRMGADPKTARMSAWQFLNKTADPRLSMLLRFCSAINVPIESLFTGKPIIGKAFPGKKKKQ